ncbi:hypothetical protein O6H91_16G036000 [Diphasiastrum complanatum]|uniref:Uncharacterized protein n=1 Tax=Diphasiastrum complanatum TaxID=34168 RepID=A0ACC2BBE6_DIPCM|nr:hypothetical protein O6H91_16G036000 [Diphasiastrum complanatum]
MASRRYVDLQLQQHTFIGALIAISLVLLVAGCTPVAAITGSIRVTNNIPDSIIMSCVSKHENLGLHVMKLNDSLELHFSAFPWTKYWCDFQWRGQQFHEITWTFSLEAISSNFDCHLETNGMYFRTGASGDKQFFQPWQ